MVDEGDEFVIGDEDDLHILCRLEELRPYGPVTSRWVIDHTRKIGRDYDLACETGFLEDNNDRPVDLSATELSWLRKQRAVISQWEDSLSTSADEV